MKELFKRLVKWQPAKRYTSNWPATYAPRSKEPAADTTNGFATLNQRRRFGSLGAIGRAMGRKKHELSSQIRKSDAKTLYRIQMEFAHGGYITFFRGTEIVADGRITSREFASLEKAMKWFLGI